MSTSFFCGRLYCEDFSEIGLCWGTGYGSAALKSVLGLYERAVALRCLLEHPQKLPGFSDHHHVASYKLMVLVEETLGTKTVPDETRMKLKADFEAVKDRIMVTACEPCGTKRLDIRAANRILFQYLKRPASSAS